VRSVISVVVLLGLLASACGGADETVIYSGRTEQLVRPILDRINAEEELQIAVRYGDSAELALLIDSEGEESAADVFYSQSPGATGFLGEQGRLGTLPDDILDQVDERFRSDQGRWVGVTARQRVLVYNTEMVDPETLPDSVFAVTGMAEDVAVAPANGSFQDFVTAMRLEHGDDETRAWLEAMNDSPAYANNSAIVEAVSRGEVPMGLVNHYYAYRFLDEDPDLPIANHVFADGDVGSILIPSTISVTASSVDNADALDMVRFMLSPEAQEYFAQETREYPLAAGVEPPGNIPALDMEQATLIDVDALGAGLSDTLDLIREAGLEG
jgi:iron(III) transport system substrate-binding protein